MNKKVEKIVDEFETKHNLGFTKGEIIELLKKFPKVTEAQFWDKFGVNTCAMIEEEVIYYYVDIITAINCCLENREKSIAEWD